jgi:hypothetical protein
MFSPSLFHIYTKTQLLLEQTRSWDADKGSGDKKIPSFYGSRRFVTLLTTASLFIASRDSGTKSISSYTTLGYTFIVPCNLRLNLPSGLSLSRSFLTDIDKLT